MPILEAFGAKVGRLAQEDGMKARSLLLTGYHAQLMKLLCFPNRRLPKSKQYLADLVMRYMISILSHPERTAMTSLFVPCEPLLSIGYLPYSVEGLSAYMTGTRCQDALLDAEDGDLSLCSYHRIYLGGTKLGLMPKPKFAIYTNVACDANMITFPHLSHQFGIPRFALDVPYEISAESISYVASQLQEMILFIEDCSKRKVDKDKLKDQVRKSRISCECYQRYLRLQKGRYLVSDVVSNMYEIITNHGLLGSDGALKYWRMALSDIQRAPLQQGLKILWLHTIPFAQAPVRAALNFSSKAHISACEMSYESMLMDMDENRPYLSMAKRLVCSSFNGSVDHRIEQALKVNNVIDADGAVFFGHWGCKATLGSSSMVKKALEDASLPVLWLDGDGCDLRNQSDGQTQTRLQAFLEMLEAKKR
ncbi:MAG: 2-hydroxyacyl-CoA dehydratase family protein [Sphaerochaetaceae bacterium]